MHACCALARVQRVVLLVYYTYTYIYRIIVRVPQHMCATGNMLCRDPFVLNVHIIQQQQTERVYSNTVHK